MDEPDEDSAENESYTDKWLRNSHHGILEITEANMIDQAHKFF